MLGGLREHVDAVLPLGIPTPMISAAFMARFSSQGSEDFGARVLAMLRHRFGGHVMPRVGH